MYERWFFNLCSTVQLLRNLNYLEVLNISSAFFCYEELSAVNFEADLLVLMHRTRVFIAERWWNRRLNHKVDSAEGESGSVNLRSMVELSLENLNTSECISWQFYTSEKTNHTYCRLNSAILLYGREWKENSQLAHWYVCNYLVPFCK